VVLHLAWAMLTPNAPPVTAAEPPPPVELSIIASSQPDQEQARAPAEAPVRSRRERIDREASPTPLAPTAQQARVRPSSSEKPPQPAATDAFAPPSSDEPAVAPLSAAKTDAPANTASSAASAPAYRPRPIDLSAVAAAATMRDQPALSPSLSHGRVCDRPNRGLADACDAQPDTGPAVNEQLRQSLQTTARTIPHLARRAPPALRRDANGGYHYDGSVFRAQIGLDGRVAFDDVPVLQPGPIPLTGSFDISDAVEKQLLKRELYSAEKQWFLDQTSALRNQLADSFRAREWSQTKVALEREFERILADAHLGAAQKRAAIYALWQDCGDDAEAGRVRNVIEALVRRRMPVGSALGYGAAELDTFNRAASGGQRFEPYRTVDAGTPG